MKKRNNNYSNKRKSYNKKSIKGGNKSNIRKRNTKKSNLKKPKNKVVRNLKNNKKNNMKGGANKPSQTLEELNITDPKGTISQSILNGKQIHDFTIYKYYIDAANNKSWSYNYKLMVVTGKTLDNTTFKEYEIYTDDSSNYSIDPPNSIQKQKIIRIGKNVNLYSLKNFQIDDTIKLNNYIRYSKK